MWTDHDLRMVHNLAVALRKGQFTMGGEEILAFNQTFSWIGGLEKKISEALEAQRLQPPVLPVLPIPPLGLLAPFVTPPVPPVAKKKTRRG